MALSLAHNQYPWVFKEEWLGTGGAAAFTDLLDIPTQAKTLTGDTTTLVIPQETTTTTGTATATRRVLPLADGGSGGGTDRAKNWKHEEESLCSTLPI